MHLNYYFLSQIALELQQKLQGAWLLECFTQNKDEVVFGFGKDGDDFYIKCQLGPSFQGLSFADSFHRAKSNSVDLFIKAKGLQVRDVSVTAHDRSFSIVLENQTVLLFKMHGSKSNVILYQKEKAVDQFHKSYPDLSLSLDSFAKEVAFDMQAFIASDFDFKKYLPALGKEPLEWLNSQGFQEAETEIKTEFICQLLETLQQPSVYYVVDKQGKAMLTFFNSDLPILGSYPRALEAANGFQRLYFTFTQKKKQTHQGVQSAEQKRDKLVKYIRDLETKLSFLHQASENEQTGDLLMAHLHAIPAGQEKITLFDFYQNKEREIKLKRDLSPQKNAELYYQKAKNALIEKEHVAHTLALKKEELAKWENEVQHVTEHGVAAKQKKKAEEETILPYKKFEVDGFEIRVGKNSQKNDELTLHYASKNDLWLHARGYAGSHVVIKAKAGTPFPPQVIEKAAAIAAWYSKGKTDSLCPVIVTERKYVRKSKNMNPGQVTIEREKVIMVVPDLF
jgi:predicted ribosome quality control (RQC) complex YloA/Tae2 family protein